MEQDLQREGLKTCMLKAIKKPQEIQMLGFLIVKLKGELKKERVQGQICILWVQFGGCGVTSQGDEGLSQMMS